MRCSSILEAVSAWFNSPEDMEPQTVQTATAAPPGGAVLSERYRVGVELGHGAAAVVYEATDLQNGALVALKVARPDGIGAGATAKRLGVDLAHEARIAMRLQHPNIGRVYAYESDGGQDFISMERIFGVDLSTLHRTIPRLEVADVARIGIDVLSALEHAHGRGVVHNDLKPGNLIWDGTTTHLIDFGSAVEVDRPTRVLAGSIAYMAPERLLNSPAEPRSDLYSLACTLYSLHAGAPPFGRCEATAVRGHLKEPAPRLPGPLGQVLAVALAKDPDDRFRDADLMRTALRWVATADASARIARFRGY